MIPVKHPIEQLIGSPVAETASLDIQCEFWLTSGLHANPVIKTIVSYFEWPTSTQMNPVPFYRSAVNGYKRKVDSMRSLLGPSKVGDVGTFALNRLEVCQ